MLKEQIQNDLKEAFKREEKGLVSVLRLLTAAFQNKEIEKRTKLSKLEAVEKLEELSKLTDEETLEVISSEAKKRRDSIFEFEKGGRQDLADKEKQELEILQKYLPEQLSEEEIKKLVKEAIEKVVATEIKDIRTPPSAGTLNASRILGKVMAELSPQIKGKADGGLVSRIVKELLAEQNK